MQVFSLTFNDFQVNTYVVVRDGQCLIIDPGCFGEREEKKISDFIESIHLTPLAVLVTHPHLDHMLGVPFIVARYNTPVYVHQSGQELYHQVPTWSSLFGLTVPDMPEPAWFEKEKLQIDSFNFEAYPMPGHADGSVCYYFPEIQSLFTGDVLFAGSIGRTDLPTGNYNVLMNSLRRLISLFPLTTMVYPGHGPTTTIENELRTNSFLTDLK